MLVAVGSRNASRNGLLCRAPAPSSRSPPHQDPSRLPANQSPRADPFVGQGRRQGSRRRQSSRGLNGRPPSSLVANPFPWPCCYRFNPPVAAAALCPPPPLLRLPPPATSSPRRRLIQSLVIHSLLPPKTDYRRVDILWSLAWRQHFHRAPFSTTPAKTPPLPWFPPVTSLPLANF